MASTLYVNTGNYNVSTITYTKNDYDYVFKVYTLDKSHYYDNIDHIIPNPLYNNIINYNYSTYKFATSDLNGEENTKYLKRSKTNISNILQDNFYIPSIGELGISMENIQVINDSIENLGEGYEKYKLDENKVYVSSTLHSNQNIYNKEYKITNNLSNVWNFNTSNAKISYSPVSNNYNVLSFYRFDTNILTEMDMNNDDIIVNSVNNFVNYELINNNTIYYCEYNGPANIDTMNLKYEFEHKLNDYTLEHWKLNPFSSKYFYTIINPELKETFKSNFYNYYNTFRAKNNFATNNPNSSLYEVNLDRIGYISNNGVDFIEDSGIGTASPKYMSTYTHIYYNLPVYNDTLTLIPIFGSGENNYNVKKYYPICEFYLLVPKLIDYLKINVSDCEITKRVFLELGSFNMYYIKLSFNTNYPSSNVIEFITRYKSIDYSRKYYFTIYSCNISNVLSSNENLMSYININNYYVAKHSYGWWFNQYDKNGLFSNKINGKFCYSNIIEKQETHIGMITSITPIYSDIYKDFLTYNSVYFKSNYDLSYLINNISKSLNIGNGTTNNRGLRVERIIDKDTTMSNVLSGSNMNIIKVNNIYRTSVNSNINSEGYLFPYNIQTSVTTSGTIDTEKIQSFVFSDNIINYPLLENNWWLFKYSYYVSETGVIKYRLSNNYHLFNLNTYNFYNNSIDKLKDYNVSDKLQSNNQTNIIFNNNLTYNNSLSYYLNYNDLLNYIPVLRIYRTKDQYGINNDLMFAYLYNTFKVLKNPYYYNYTESENVNYSYNCPIERYYTKTTKNNKDIIRYFNKFNLNIPIVGIKEALCLNMNMDIEPLRLFKDPNKHYYLYSDYLYIYNATNKDIDILMDDESLSLVDCKKTIFNIQSGELKVYYPSNFNYNATYRDFKNEIYNIKLYNKSSKNLKFNIINIGNLNLDIKELYDNNIYIEDQIGYKYICYLNYIYNIFKNENNTDSDTLLDSKTTIVLKMYNDIISTKEKYLLDLEGNTNKLTKQQWIYENKQNTEQNIIVHYNTDINNYQYINENNTSHENWYNEVASNSGFLNYFPQINDINIQDKKIHINSEGIYTHNLNSNIKKYLGTDYLNTITKHNIEHLINLSDSELLQVFDNYVNISIKDYSLNKAGYLVVIKNS